MDDVPVGVIVLGVKARQAQGGRVGDGSCEFFGVAPCRLRW